VRSKLEALAKRLNASLTAKGIVLTEIDDLTAAVTCALVATGSDGEPEAVTMCPKAGNANVPNAISTLTILIFRGGLSYFSTLVVFFAKSLLHLSAKAS
jgi:hypothetical protein